MWSSRSKLMFPAFSGLLWLAVGCSDPVAHAPPKEDASQDVGQQDAAIAADTGAVTADVGTGAQCSEKAQMDLYDRRIKPLVDGSQPSSCNQCHLSGVDLAMFVQSSPCETMACLVKQGLVDLDAPEKSKVLAQIKLAQPQSSLITSEVIQAEHDGFLEWITYSSKCMNSVCGKIDDACKSPSNVPGETGGAKELLGGCTEEALGKSFQAKVWKWRGRCTPCHIPPGSTQWPTKWWIDGLYKKGAGEEVAYKSALYTMYNLIGIGAVNENQPDKSIFILNPLSPAFGGLPHKGHVKIANKQEQTYKDFLAWATQYSECKKGSKK